MFKVKSKVTIGFLVKKYVGLSPQRSTVNHRNLLHNESAISRQLSLKLELVTGLDAPCLEAVNLANCTAALEATVASLTLWPSGRSRPSKPLLSRRFTSTIRRSKSLKPRIDEARGTSSRAWSRWHPAFQLGRTYLRCVHYAHHRCRGTALIRKNNIEELVEVQAHGPSCLSSVDAIQIGLFKDALKYGMQTEGRKPRQVYDTYALIYPRGAILFPYRQAVQNMYDWRRQAIPRHPVTLDEMGLQLGNPENARLLQHLRALYCDVTVNVRDLAHERDSVYDPMTYMQPAVTNWFMTARRKIRKVMIGREQQQMTYVQPAVINWFMTAPRQKQESHDRSRKSNLSSGHSQGSYKEDGMTLGSQKLLYHLEFYERGGHD
ncbi:unnamed protein product [Trichogramma brassicae]|uniref:Uncharacterized protein n=1 Tax=Trichogramma brassicae TaxID=86971 RepID=A0A6H5J9H3_9HYME|nr:unnamed protein product [Trichogramma brassicae]